MQALLDNLELLARRELRRLMVTCGVDAEDLTQMIAEIRSSIPNPAPFRRPRRFSRSAGRADAAGGGRGGCWS